MVIAYWLIGREADRVPFRNPSGSKSKIIPCSEKGEAVAKYSILNEGQQIFASKYLQFLPSEEEQGQDAGQ